MGEFISKEKGHQKCAFILKKPLDPARPREMQKYLLRNITLLNRLNTEVKPTILLDFGANIGLSTLSLINQIPSIRTSISVEVRRKFWCLGKELL